MAHILSFRLTDVLVSQKIFEPKTGIKLNNRFKCFERNTPEHDDILRETERTSPPLCGSPKAEKKIGKSKIRKTLSSNEPPPENVPSDKSMSSSSGITGVGGSPPPPPIPSVAAVVSTPETTSTDDPSRENVPSEMLTTSSSGIPGVDGFPPPPPIPPVAAPNLRPVTSVYNERLPPEEEIIPPFRPDANSTAYVTYLQFRKKELEKLKRKCQLLGL